MRAEQMGIARDNVCSGSTGEIGFNTEWLDPIRRISQAQVLLSCDGAYPETEHLDHLYANCP
jgi:hypothetical protein